MKSPVVTVVSSMLIGAAITASLLASMALPSATTAAAHAPNRRAASSEPVQIEPGAGKWKTWVLTSGDQLRLPAPPNQAVTKKELAELQAMVSKRDAKVLDQIAFWNAGAPSYRWNEMFINEAVKRNMNTLIGGRALSYLNAAIYDATIAAWDSKFAHNRPRPSVLDTSLTTIIPNPASPSYPSEHAVTAGAASAMLAYLFPEDAQRFEDMAKQAGNAFVMAGVHYPSDVQSGLELGRKIAALAIARAKADGSDAKWTGSVPTVAGKWTGEKPVLPTMGSWKTWVLSSGSELRPPPPLAYDSSQMLAELKEVQVFTRTPKSNADALFWEYAAGGGRNYVFWNDQINRKLFEYGLSENAPRAAQAYAMTSIASYDSGIACWDAKYTYWAMRPFQIDPNFKPLFTTPNHPSYPSAHSCLSSAAATTLAYLFPRDASAFNGLAKQASESRIWSGLHFRSDLVAGNAIGVAVAQKVIDRAKSTIQ